MAHILVVDDAPDICALLKAALVKDGHCVTALQQAKDVTPALCGKADLLLLDVMMPDEDGFSVCKRVREWTDCPILFLTAKDGETDILTGLALGGDDYLTKPFKLTELRARIAAHLRRTQRVPMRRFVCGNLHFDLAGKTLYYNDTMINLTKSEYALCEMLARHAGLVYTREQLIEAAFGYENESDTAAVTEHIKNLRAKLGVYHIAPVETVWGMGYRWNNEKASV
ncbi:MAG: response regulator transcription factor [Ruthenibacterium sp.]